MSGRNPEAENRRRSANAAPFAMHGPSALISAMPWKIGIAL
jgi:hypothetical protein